MKKSHIITGLVGVTAMVGGGLLIGRMTSDDTASAELLIVPRPVERRSLDDVVTINGEVRRQEIQEINLPVDGKVSSLTVEDGDTVNAGDDLFALDGRSSVAVAGDFAFFRQLDVGSEGPDVQQLETILAASGYPISSVDSLFTEETRRALADWQRDRGYGGATPENTETITVGLSPNQAGYSIGKSNTVAFTLEPAPSPGSAGFGASRHATAPPTSSPSSTTTTTPAKPVIQMSATPLEVDEGTNVVFTFTASPAPTSDLTVDLTIGGDATGGQRKDSNTDYRTIDNSFVMPAGSSKYTITVPIYVDEVKEDSEDLTVSLTDQFGNDPNYVVGPANQARIRIRANGDDLVPIITVEASSARVSEGGSATFTFRSTVESNEDLDLKVALGGSAVSGADFVKVDLDQITIPAGSKQTTLNVQFRSDDLVEADEQFLLKVVDTADYALGSPAQVGVVIESSDLPELTLQGGSAIREGDSASFTIVADSPVTADTSINYQLGGTAQPGSDYDTLSGTALMSAGTSRVTISIVTIDDDVIFLPSDMVVAEWPARVGKVLVDEGEFVLQGAPVLTLNEPDFTITLSVTAEERSDLEVGQTVSVSLDAVDADLNGTIATLDENATVADDGSETYEGTVEVDGDVAAVDGARATIDVTLSERPNVLAVPVAAVLRSAGGDEVRVINDAGTISRVKVTIGLVDGEWVEIVDGLKGDELVVVDVDPKADTQTKAVAGG
jgi:multidrug efflux pump subunit AcrA (membrane-fusion protein)